MEFETKVDVKYKQNNEIVIPMVSFCKTTSIMFRNSSQNNSSEGLSPAQFYNQTFSFGEVFILIEFISLNDKYYEIVNFTDGEQNNNEIYYEKTISFEMICYHFKYLHSKQLKHKEGRIYKFWLYHQNNVFLHDTFIFNHFPYILFLSSNINYPNIHTDNPILLFDFCF